MLKNRSNKIKKALNRFDSLHVRNNLYQKNLKLYCQNALLLDLSPHGDITTDFLFQERNQAIALIISKESGVLAGMEEVEWFIKTYLPLNSGLTLTSKYKDGQKIKVNSEIVKLTGDIQLILALERTILNIMQRMSGIASKTRELVNQVAKINPYVLITATRKTPLGLLDKKAVSVGGGGTHRLNLSDAILIKDTHLDYQGRNIEQTLSKLLHLHIPAKFIEIETQNGHEAIVAAKFFSKTKFAQKTCIVMLDNFSPVQIISTIKELKIKSLYDHVLLEASGGINQKNIQAYAQTGVDAISLGFITHSAKALDMSLKIHIYEQQT